MNTDGLLESGAGHNIAPNIVPILAGGPVAVTLFETELLKAGINWFKVIREHVSVSKVKIDSTFNMFERCLVLVDIDDSQNARRIARENNFDTL